MQLVIDISEADYKYFTDANEKYKLKENTFTWMIANGTPLPKGHGRLVDADTLWDSFQDSNGDFYEALDDTPTLLEAEEEEENDERRI